MAFNRQFVGRSDCSESNLVDSNTKRKQLPEPTSPDPSVKGLSLSQQVDIDQTTIRVFDRILIVDRR
jgi:hypothetical protein